MNQKEYIEKFRNLDRVSYATLQIAEFESDCTGSNGDYFVEFKARVDLLNKWFENEISSIRICASGWANQNELYGKKKDKLERRYCVRRYRLLLTLKGRRDREDLGRLANQIGIQAKCFILDWLEEKIRGWIDVLFVKLRGPKEFEEDCT